MAFRINYDRVISQAGLIESEASELADQIKTLEQLEQECRAAWQGEAATVFIGKLAALRLEISRTKRQMSDLAATIKYCADRIQKQDREAEKRAAALKTGQ